uniref:DUF1351 domain-containing protein n=1 Tax=Agathobacter sp. TaxID=2021311 RepID=UPI004026F22E
MQKLNLSVQLQNGTIDANFDSIKAALAAELDTYKKMVFTEDSKKDAKDTVAYLRKFNKALDDKRKEVKKAYMAPCDAFEVKVNELKKQVDEPIKFINEQIEEFERKRVEEKRALIKDIYTGIAAEHAEAAEYLPLQKIYDKCWENATTTKKAITEAITERMTHVETDLTTIRSMESEYEDKGIERYKATLELSVAIATMNQFQKQKEEILRREKEREERIEAEEEKEEPSGSAVPVIPAVPTKEPKEESAASVPAGNTVRYEVIADLFQIAQLESAMREYGIKFRRV